MGGRVGACCKIISVHFPCSAAAGCWVLAPSSPCLPACPPACRGNSLLEALPEWMPEAMPQLELLDVSACARLDLRTVVRLTQLQTLALQVRRGAGQGGAQCLQPQWAQCHLGASAGPAENVA